jgi:hypothetical protein
MAYESVPDFYPKKEGRKCSAFQRYLNPKCQELTKKENKL